MYKIFRYYNQNKLKVWIGILLIIFLLILIKTLNANIKNNDSKNNDKETTSNVVSYRNQSKSMVDGGSVSETYSEGLGKFINQFFSYCIEHNPHNAYSMLSNDTKQELYQTEELFVKNYYQSRFNGNKDFSFQSWSSVDNVYIYQVKIFDNMLATGQSSENYIEEYVTISNEDGEYKLNINSYLGRKNINKKSEDKNLSVEVIRVDRYLDYEIYTLSVQNKKETDMILDTRRKTSSCYVKDDRDNKFEALLYENKEEELAFSPNEKKTIRIKFSDSNRKNLKIESINFTDIVESNEYIKNSKINGESFTVEI